MPLYPPRSSRASPRSRPLAFHAQANSTSGLWSVKCITPHSRRTAFAIDIHDREVRHCCRSGSPVSASALVMRHPLANPRRPGFTEEPGTCRISRAAPTMDHRRILGPPWRDTGSRQFTRQACACSACNYASLTAALAYNQSAPDNPTT